MIVANFSKQGKVLERSSVALRTKDEVNHCDLGKGRKLGSSGTLSNRRQWALP